MLSPSYVISRFQGRWAVACHDQDSDNSFPTTLYATPEEAIARLAQLMDVKEAIVPQSWPEEVCLNPADPESKTPTT